MFSSSPTSTPFFFLCSSSYKGKKKINGSIVPSLVFSKILKPSCTTGSGVSPRVPYRDDVLGSELRGFRFRCVCWQGVAESAESIQRHGAALRAGSTRQLRQFKNVVKLRCTQQKEGEKGTPVKIYERLRKVSPLPRGYLISFDDINFDRLRHRTDHFLQKDADSACLYLYLLSTDTRTDTHTQLERYLWCLLGRKRCLNSSCFS